MTMFALSSVAYAEGKYTVSSGIKVNKYLDGDIDYVQCDDDYYLCEADNKNAFMSFETGNVCKWPQGDGVIDIEEKYLICLYDDDEGEWCWSAVEDGDGCCAAADGNSCIEIKLNDEATLFVNYSDGGIYAYKSQCEGSDGNSGNARTQVIATVQNNPDEMEAVVNVSDMVLAHKDYEEILKELKGYKLLDRSVWKTEDGKFNTARLMVDVGSGAVLGTVGGVIANTVIRKNQISSGMEGYQCHINGQVVADYGDEFVVDIYK